MVIRVPDIRAWPPEASPLVAITAYDRPSALAVERAGFEIVLVGDSAAQVIHGRKHTTSLGMEEILIHLKAVRPFITHSLLVADMPFGPVQVGDRETKEAAVALVAAGAEAVKIEGGDASLGAIRRLTNHGIEVMGHLGLTPQSVHTLGGYKVQGTGRKAASQILKDALALEQAGAFAIVLECLPAPLAALITKRLSIPTLGIGSGSRCRGQILVFHDVVGWEGSSFKFLPHPFGDVSQHVDGALSRYKKEVQEGNYPEPDQSWELSPEEIEGL